MTESVRVLISGAAGQIGYVMSHWIADGMLFGQRKIILHLFESTSAQSRLDALAMELQDSSFRYLDGVVATTNPEEGFKDVDVAFLLCTCFTRPGQKRLDILANNAKIYKQQGEYLNKYAKPTCKVLVTGNPANTNALVTLLNAPNLKPENFTSLSYLDHLRITNAVAIKLNIESSKIRNVIVWGNHSDTLFPDISQAYFEKDGEKNFVSSLLEEKYIHEELPDYISKRGWQILNYRGLSSASSPCLAAILTMKAFLFGTEPDQIISMGAIVPQSSPYGLQPGLLCSLPCTVDKDGKVHIVEDLQLNDWVNSKLKATEEELIQEKEYAMSII
ncbi:malate dehydrogenase family protein [Trichomonas vaginalis G3]|uniref:malate dehydrogenase n=1 Tax=Trichomonas vaginalis (strain ATCC PRA-98 / G3) TaxID=412133 RepID=A2EFX9_TRIV3|nr:malate dehydrogenase [Trichomonas vaginalis G3]EAY08435.1 malate dehydrogenase family protein [Trichomonas vaginalis G3]KAI5518133.1 MDH domain-containing protein [Trichomonas vaginalis G3]|eukprot:XP_001320658.1 malate dehydrogenase [Trichomonas vaginalis G3]